jgi:hypothetical protein
MKPGRQEIPAAKMRHKLPCGRFVHAPRQARAADVHTCNLLSSREMTAVIDAAPG